MGASYRNVRTRGQADCAAVREAIRSWAENDMQDAAAICEAASRPEMRSVPQKSIGQQDMQMLHRIRSRLVGNRTQLGNQIRGLLAEYGIIIPLHLSQVRKHLIELTSDPHAQMTPFGPELFRSLYTELRSIDERIAAMEQRIQEAFHGEEACKKIAQVEGVGPVIATAIVAANRRWQSFSQRPAAGGLAGTGSASTFKWRQTKAARHFQARRSVPPYAADTWRSLRRIPLCHQDSRSRWIADKQRRLGTTKACVAVVNKNARIIWALLAKDEQYRRAA